MKAKTKKILLSALIIIVLLVVIISVYLNMLLRASLPITDGEIKINGIKAPVQITFDKMGIPQIWAKNEADAWFAVGWLHTNDRLFQMELTRRVSQGRLSEMFGDITLEFDRIQRKIGHTRMAKAEVEKLSKLSKTYLQAYVNGINSRANSFEHLPFEYLLLGLDLEPWKIEDCLSVLSFQSWYSDDLQNNDKLYFVTANKFGDKRARELFFDYPKWGQKTVPQSGSIHQDENRTANLSFYHLFNPDLNSFNFLNPFKASLLSSLFSQNRFPMSMSHSSNCWVVSLSRSKSGYALFASDPHLELTRLPQFWYFLGIHTEGTGLNVLGITTPGLPFVVMGHNSKAAWAFTVGGVDITDHFIEKINPDNLNQYETVDGWKDFETLDEILFSHTANHPETLQVKFSRHGPIMSENDSLGLAYTLKWAGHDKSIAIAAEAGFSLAKISSFKNFRNAVTHFGALDANWMYADKNGNIGYQLGTPIPIRNNYNQNLAQPGWTNENDWQGYYPEDKTPHIFNPDQGWLATSNNKPDEENLDYLLYGNFAYDRIMRITELLESKKIFAVSDFETFQMDSKSKYLLRWREEAVKILLLLKQDDLAKKIGNWDGSADVNSKEIALIETWLFLFRKLSFEDELGGLNKKVKFLFMEKENLPENSQWYDDISTEEKVENRSDIQRMAMEKALEIVADKRWGEMQTLTIAHPMAQVPVLSNLLDLQRGPFPRGGTAGTLNASFNTLKEDKFSCIIGPSWRFILDFAHIDNATILLPAGQSGHPLSAHFFDFYTLWANGDRWNVPFSKNRVDKQKVSLLKLSPITN